MTIADNLLVAGLVLGLILWRQLQPRPIRGDRPYLLMVVLAGLGIVDLAGFVGDHRVDPTAWALLIVGLAVGAGLGLARGALVHVWRSDGVLMRQGSWLTVVLWGVGLAVHVLLDLVIDGADRSATGIGSYSILLYLGVALAAQRYATLSRASHLAR